MSANQSIHSQNNSDHEEDGDETFPPVPTAPSMDVDGQDGQVPGTSGQPAFPDPKTPSRRNAGKARSPPGPNPGGLGKKGVEAAPLRLPSLISMFNQRNPSTLPEGASLEEEIIALRKKKIIAAQEEPSVILSFPNFTAPRCMKTGGLWKAFLANPEVAAGCVYEIRKGREFVWVSVFKTTNVTDTEVDLFREGVACAAADKVIADLNPEDYTCQVLPDPGRCSAFLVSVADKDAMERILKKRVWTVRKKEKQASFFINRDDSWGSHIILDINSGGANFENDVLPRLYGVIGSAFETKKPKKPRTVAFTDLAYHRVTLSDHTHKGTRGITWRVKFKPSESARVTTWKYPAKTGYGNRGAIEIKTPPFCPHCVSYSHQQAMCQWWSETLMAGTHGRPAHQIDVAWIPIESASYRKLGLEK
ncbi:hypothetical protein FRC01_014848 [Tulasnella sp. 417]|nr:hypothetical protein FRC01_014848 [Tulasnella sp. 417]